MLRASKGKLRARRGAALGAVLVGSLVAVGARGAASGLHADAKGLAAVCVVVAAVAVAIAVQRLGGAPARRPPGRPTGS